MRLTAILNREIPLGKVLNGLGHLTLGLGHRLEGAPDINVFFATSEQIKRFRQTALDICKEREPAIYNDFPHTMEGGDTPKQLEICASTPESDMTYFASYFVSPDNDPRLEALTKQFRQLKAYQPYTGEAASAILEEQAVEPTATDKMIKMVVSDNPLNKTINPFILTCLAVGKKADHAELRLLEVPDNDAACNFHGNISFHPFLIAKASKPAFYKEIARNVKENQSLTTHTSELVSLAFGDAALVDGVMPRNKTRLFQTALKETDLAPATEAESAPAASTSSAVPFDGGVFFTDSSSSSSSSSSAQVVPAGSSNDDTSIPGLGNV